MGNIRACSFPILARKEMRGHKCLKTGLQPESAKKSSEKEVQEQILCMPSIPSCQGHAGSSTKYLSELSTASISEAQTGYCPHGMASHICGALSLGREGPLFSPEGRAEPTEAQLRALCSGRGGPSVASQHLSDKSR